MNEGSEGPLCPSISRKRRLVVIPGFLTEPGSLSKAITQSRFAHLDPTSALDERAWLSVTQASVDSDVSVEVMSWASQSVFRMLGEVIMPIIERSLSLASLTQRVDTQLIRAAFKVKEVWSDAVAQSEEAVNRLVHLIQTSPDDEELYLLGHSLGGRIVLKSMMAIAGLEEAHLNSTPYTYPKVSVWAPAISQREVNWELLSTVDLPPEIFFSRADLVLKLCFPLGQAPIKNLGPLELLKITSTIFDRAQQAVGLNGPIDLTHLRYTPTLDLSDQAMTHLGYLWALDDLIGQSVYLSSLRSSGTSPR